MLEKLINGPALIRILFKALKDEVAEAAIWAYTAITPSLGNCIWLLFQDVPENFMLRSTKVRLRTRCHLICQATEGPNVARLRKGTTLDDLWSIDRSQSDSQVSKFDLTVARTEYVFRHDLPVQHILRVHLREACGYLEQSILAKLFTVLLVAITDNVFH